MKGTYMWLIGALVAALLLVLLGSGVQAGEVFLDDWEDGNMNLPDDLDGSSGDKAGWYMTYSLPVYYRTGWDMNTKGYPYQDQQEPYEGDYCTIGQLNGYSQNATLYFYIDLTNSGEYDYAENSDVSVSFWYTYTNDPRYGAVSTSLYMYVFDDDDDSYTTVWTGDVTNTAYYPVPGAGEDIWVHADVDIGDYITATSGEYTRIYFSLKATTTGYARYYLNYAKIDYLEFDIKENLDFAVDNLTATPAYSEVNETALVKAAVRNDGNSSWGSDISIKMTVTDSDGTPVDSQEATITDGLDVNEWTWVYFNVSEVSENGLEIYDITVEIDMGSNDKDSYDDSKTVQIYRYWIKWTEGFETGDMVAPLPADSGWWVSDPLGDNGGYSQDGGAGLNTDPQYTYPSGSTSPYEGDYCMIERVSRYETGTLDVSAYVSFDMSGWDNVGIGFYYDVYVYTSSYYFSYYHAEVYASDDGGSNWELLEELPKDQTVNNWESVVYDISGNPDIDMTSNVTFRFRWRCTYQYRAYTQFYFKWDSIMMTGDPLDKDVALRELVIPSSLVRLGDEIDISATVKNVGKDTVSPTVNIVITDQWGNEALNDTKSAGSLESLWSKEITWTGFEPAKVTRYFVNATAILSTDEFIHNNMMSTYFDSLPLMFFEDFEDGNTNATDNTLPADSGWYISKPFPDSALNEGGGGLTSDYQFSTWSGDPIEGDYSAMLTLSQFDDDDSVYMDVSFLNATYEDPLTLSFLWDIYGNTYYYAAFVNVSYDNGTTWTTLNDGKTLPMDYVRGNSATFIEKLPTWEGDTPENITIRFAFVSTMLSWWDPYPDRYFKFDLVQINFPLMNDLSAVGADAPDIAGAGEAIPVEVTVENVGYSQETEFDVIISLYNEDGSLYDDYTETISDTLEPGEIGTYEIEIGPVVFDSGKKVFRLKAKVDLPGDLDNTNDITGGYDLIIAWLAFFDTFETGDLVAPGAVHGWNLSEELTYMYGGGAGLNTDGYSYPAGRNDAYGGSTYCAYMQVAYGYAVSAVYMDVTIWTSGWDDLNLLFMYDTYAYYYSYYYDQYEFEIWGKTDGNGLAWTQLNGGSDLTKDSTVNNWALHDENLSANSALDLANSTYMVLRFKLNKTMYRYGSYSHVYFKFDNVMLIGAPPPDDAAVTSLELSATKVVIDKDIDFAATIKNAGGDYQDSIDVDAEIIDQWGNVAQTWPTRTVTNLASGQSDIERWTWRTDIKPSMYTVVVTVSLSGDANPWNDEMTATFETGPFIFYDDYEDLNLDATDNVLNATYGWNISLDMPEDGRGPGIGIDRNAYDGRGAMVYRTDNSVRRVWANFTLDTSTKKGATIQFWYDWYLYYSYTAYNFIEVQVNNNSGSGWVTISDDDDFISSYPTQGTWYFWQGYIGEDFMVSELSVQIVYWHNQYSYWSYYFKLDDLIMKYQFENDLAITDLIAPPRGQPGEEVIINASVMNQGWGSQTDFPMVMEVYYASNDTLAHREKKIIPDTLGKLETMWVEFIFSSQRWEATDYLVNIFTGLSNDQDDRNNATDTDYEGFWYLIWEDFEGEEKLVATDYFVSSGWWPNDKLENDYQQSGIGRSDDGYNTRVEYGDYAGHAQLGYNYYNHDNKRNVYMDVHLRSYGWTNVTFNFDYSFFYYYYYVEGAAVELFNGTDWYRLYTVPTISNDREWHNSGDITIPDYMLAPNMTLRIRVWKTSGYMYGYYNFEFDNILITGVAPHPVADDIGVHEITAPTSGTVINYDEGNFNITALVGNYGSNQATFTADVVCTNLGYGDTETPDHVWPDDGEHTIDGIRFLADLEIQSWSWTPTLHGVYEINVSVTLTSGTAVNIWNDYLTTTVSVASIVIDTDFEDSDENFTHWASHSGFDEWEYGVPTYSTNARGGGTMDKAHSGTKCWGTDLDSYYEVSYSYPQEYLESPKIDVTSGYAGYLSFWHTYDCYGSSYRGYAGGNLKISTDGGTNFEIIEPMSGYPQSEVYGLRGGDESNSQNQPGWSGHKYSWSDYSSGGWINAMYDISDYLGNEIVLRWQFGTYGYNYYQSPGWYIDDLRIWTIAKKWDIGVKDIIASNNYPAFDDVAQAGEEEETRAIIQNNGLYDFTASYDVTLDVIEADYVNVMEPYNSDIEDTIAWRYYYPYYPNNYESDWCRYGYAYGITRKYWEDGTPEDVGPDTAHGGSRCLATDLDGEIGGGGDGYWYTYFDFCTPSIFVDPEDGDLSTVSWHEWFDTEQGHTMYAWISRDGGNYQYVNSESGYRSGPRDSSGWVQSSTADISDVTEKFRLRFRYYVFSYYYDYEAAPGWYIDDFEALQLRVSNNTVYTNTQTITDDIAQGDQSNITWTWTPSDEGYYFYNVSIDSDEDEYADNNLSSELKFIGKWFDVWDFEVDHPELGHEWGFDSEDLSTYGDLWNIVEKDESTYFSSWSPYHSDYAWWCGYENTTRNYPHSPIGSMTGSYDLGMNNILVTPSVDLKYAKDVYMTFWHKYIFQGEGEGYNGDGSDDGGFVEVSVNGGLTWDQVTPMDGYDGRIRTNAISRGGGYDAFMRQKGWARETINLAPYAGDDVMIRFRFTSYYYSDRYADLSGNHGWYIDDILFYGSEYEENTGLGHVLLFQNTYNDGTFVENIEMTIHVSGGNIGKYSNEDVTIDMWIEDENGYTVWSESESTDGFDTWAKKWTPEDSGVHTIYVETNAVEDDENSDDNNYDTTFWVAALALYEDVESGAGLWTHGGANDFWHIEDIMYNSEEHAWYMGHYDAINETWTYAPETEAALSSPEFDLRSFRSATMTWSSWWSLERDRDGFNIEFSEDEDDWTPRFGGIGQSSHGVFWQNPTLGHRQNSNANSFNLRNFVGEKVFMRVVVRSDRNSITDGDGNPETPSGVFIDDIMIYGDQYDSNVGIDRMSPPEGSHIVPGQEELFIVNVTNLGRKDQSMVRINMSIIYASNGTEEYVKTTTIGLSSLESGQGAFLWDVPMYMDGEQIIFRGTVEIKESGDWTTDDENPSDNVLELMMDVAFWHDISVDEIITEPIVSAGEDLEMSALITNYGNVPENDFDVTFAAGPDVTIEYSGIDGSFPRILIYNGYSTYDSAIYWEAVSEALTNLGIPDAVVTAKNRSIDGNLNDADIENHDAIIYVQLYGPIGNIRSSNNPDVDKLTDYLDNGGNLFILGDDITYYGTYYYYSYYRNFCRDYLKTQYTTSIYDWYGNGLTFTGDDKELSEERDWVFNDYYTRGNSILGGGERVFTFDYYYPNYVAATKFNGTLDDSEPFKSVYMGPTYYQTYMAGGSATNNQIDEYEIDLMTNVLNWFFGERTLNLTTVDDTETITIHDEIAPGETREVFWTWDQNPPGLDDYQIAVISELPGDNMTSNDFKIADVMGRTILFRDDFEEGTVKYPANESTEAVWEHYGKKDQWQSVNMSWHYGGEDEINLYNSADQAWWCGNVNTTKYVDNVIAYLETPVLNLTTMSEANIAFWLRFAAEDGHDYMQVFIDTPDLLTPEAVSPPFTGYNTEWEWFTYDISDYTGGEATILFLFFSDGNGIHEESALWLDTGETWSGTFIDDIMVYGIEYDFNLAPKITAPANETVFFMDDDVVIESTLTNRGTQNWLGQDAADVYIKIYDETNDPGTYELEDTLQSNVEVMSGATRILTPYTWQAPSEENITYRIEVSIDEALDEAPEDDVFMRWITVRPRFDAAAVSIDVDDVVKYGEYPNVHITYENLGNKLDDLDANVSILKLADEDLLVESLDTGAPDDWTESEDALWEQEDVMKPFNTTGYSMHGNTPHVSFLGEPGVTTWDSPEIDLGVSPTALLSFKHVYNIEPQDGAMVMASIDDGETWEQLTPAGGYPSSTSISTGMGASNFPAYNKLLGSWEIERFDLAKYFGTTIRIRFVLTYDGSSEEYRAYPSQTPIPGGWFIDDIVVSGNNISEEVAATTYSSSMLPAYGFGDPEYQDWAEWQAEYGQYFIRLEVFTDLDENLTNNVVQTEMAVANVLFRDDGDTYQEPGWSKTGTIGKESEWQPLDPDSSDDDDWTTFGEYEGVAWWCGDEVGKTYENNLNNNLSTRSINLVHTEFVYMRFFHKHSFKLPAPGYDPEDKGIVQVASVNDRGVVQGEWHTIRIFELVDYEWHKETMNVSAEVPEGVLDGKTVFRFWMYSGPSTVKPEIKGWFIDDIIIFGQPYETNVGIESTTLRWIYSAEETYDGSDDHPAPTVDVTNYGTSLIPSGAITVSFDVYDSSYKDTFQTNWYDYAGQQTTINTALDVLDGISLDFTWTAPTLPTELLNNTLYFVFSIEMPDDMHETDNMTVDEARIGKMMAYWDFEGPNATAGWTLGSDWQLTDYRSASGDSVYGGDNTTHQYGAEWRTHLESPMIYLTGVTVELAFWHKYDFNTSDYAYVYIFATDDPDDEPSESDWRLLAVFQGTNDPVETLDLSDYSWMYVKFRFTLSSNPDQYFGEGWYLDDVAVYGLEPYAAGHLAPNIRNDFLYPNYDETDSSLTYEGVEIGNLGSNSDTIYWELSIRSKFKFTYVYNETNVATDAVTERTNKGMVWFDALNWSFDIYDTVSETYEVQDAKISDQTHENAYGERVYNTSLSLAAGEVRHWTITVRAADEDHFNMIDAWKGTYYMNMTAISEGAEDQSPYKESYAQLTPEILPPDVSLDKDKLFFMDAETQVLEEETFTAWLLIPNEGTYMHNVRLSVWITAGKSGVKITGPTVTGEDMTYTVVSGEKAEFYVGPAGLLQTFGSGEDTTLVSVLPPSISNETPYEYKNSKYMLVAVTLDNLPQSARSTGTITINFELGAKEFAESPAAEELALTYASKHDMLPLDTMQYEYKFVEVRAHLEDSRPADNGIELDVQVVNKRQQGTGFSPALATLAMAALVVSAVVVVVRRKSEED